VPGSVKEVTVMEDKYKPTCHTVSNVAKWEMSGAAKYRDMLVYALGLGVTLLLVWLRDPYALY
jgi:hypothetical protein